MSKSKPIRAFDLASGALAFGLLCLAIAACGQALNDNNSRAGLVLDLGPDPACENVVCSPGMVCQAGLCVVPSDMANQPDLSSGADQGRPCDDDDDENDDDDDRTPDLSKHSCGGNNASGGSCPHRHP